MLRILTGLWLGLTLAGCDNPASNAAATPAAAPTSTAPLPRRDETIKAADQTPISGWLYEAPKPKAIVLLFHQAGSSKGEYATIAPRLAAEGYTALAIDQRSGGDLFGENATVERLGHSAGYLEAKQDLQAALDWAKPKGVPVIIWGSSYSSALVFLVAAENPDAVKGVLAFSPGEYLGAPNLVKDAAARVTAPVFVTSAKDADEIAAAKAILGAVPGADKTQFVPGIAGVHGSSTLIDARNAKGAAENWAAVDAFLKHLVP